MLNYKFKLQVYTYVDIRKHTI